MICGENRLACLSLDHIKGGGNQERKKLKKMGRTFYQWLKKQGYPPEHQTLCMNCQFVKKQDEK